MVTKKKATKKTPRKTTKKKTPKRKPTKKVSHKKVARAKGKRGNRAVLYKREEVKVVRKLTAEDAKELLGWEEEPKKGAWGKGKKAEEFLLRDLQGNKVRCTNNAGNRWLTLSNVQALCQEMLRGNWYLNMEPRIIGRTGLVLNGQHTLIALVLANQMWEKDPKDYPHWKEPPVIDTVICYGAPEDDNVVNTMDTARPRTLAEVLGRSGYFSGERKLKRRKRGCRMLEHAIKVLWERTKVRDTCDYPKLRQTHAEALDLANRHPKLLECVELIMTENDKPYALAGVVPQGLAAGFLYLMGSSTSDPQLYLRKGCRESALAWDLWEKACEFFVLLSSKGDKLKPLDQAFGKLAGNPDYFTRKAVISLMLKGWLLYANGKTLTPKLLALSFTEQDGLYVCDDEPLTGGIDIGDIPDLEDDDEDEPSVEEKARIRKATKREKQNGQKQVGKKKGKEWAEGDTAWVYNPKSIDPEEVPIFGRLTCNPFVDDLKRRMVDVETPEGKFEVALEHLTLEKPTPKPVG